MLFEVFCDEIKERVENLLSGVTCQLTTDAGGVTRLSIDDGSEGVPAFNMVQLYENFISEDGNLNRYARGLANEFLASRKAIEKAGEMDVFDKVRDKIYPSFINKEAGADKLSYVAHIDKGDYSIIYRVTIEQSEDGVHTCLITDNLLNHWGISIEELDRISWENSVTLMPAMMAPIGDLLPGLGAADVPLYVVSNETRMHGATAMWYPGVAERMSDIMNGDFYILPSSVHEVICVPETDGALEELKKMVMFVNQTEVSARDKFSDNVYKYTGGTITCVA